MRHFDLCVIGSGSGNALVNSAFRDQSVAIVDRAPWFGGTCLNAGCIPSKMLSYPADLAESARHASELGVDVGKVSIRWDDLRDRVFSRVDAAAQAAEAQRERHEGITVFRENAGFVGRKRLLIGEAEVITADQFVIAAGSRPWLPELPGLDAPEVAARVHTSDDVMRLPELPASVVIVGGGSVAAEFAHIFAACGVSVTLLNRGPRLLRIADETIAQGFTQSLSERVTLRFGQTVASLEASQHGSVIVGTVDADGVEYFFEGERVLLALGRVPNGDTLNLAATGVELDELGRVVVDAHQRTTADGIWALGDVSSPYQLKHVANHEMRVVQHNLLHPDDLVETDHRFVPQAVFSNPQVAWVGLTEQALRASGRPYVSSVREYASVAYGWAMEDSGHFAKLLADPDT
ncbi:MAG: mycothione reductase, partial [Propionibacteriaceae bacterium]|nr:mycothione reductase [Propionibacteriaceae bacterium]